ncbi:hypothetical protein GCM10028798_21370 [Humibacter antri]
MKRTAPAYASADAPAPSKVSIGSTELDVTVETLGARISSIVDRRTGTEFLLRTPWANEHWDPIALSAGTSAEWHGRYQGGWHTLVPHAGDQRWVAGIEHPFHGEASWRTWRLVMRDDAVCAHEVVLRTAPLRITRCVSVDGSTVRVEQRVENFSPEPIDFTWTEHPALGPAVVGPRTAVTTPEGRLDLVFPQSEEGVSGFRSLRIGDRGEATVTDPDSGAFARLRWDARLMPYLHVWQEHHATDGFPWWRTNSAIALEPASRDYWPDEDGLGPVVVQGRGAVDGVIELTVGVRENQAGHTPVRESTGRERMVR